MGRSRSRRSAVSAGVMDDVRTGGCLCGAIRYCIAAPPVLAFYCHCRICQRADGAPVVAWLTVPSASSEVIDGKAAAYRSFGQGVAAVLRRLRHIVDLAGDRQLRPPRCQHRHPRRTDAVAPGLHLWTQPSSARWRWPTTCRAIRLTCGRGRCRNLPRGVANAAPGEPFDRL